MAESKRFTPFHKQCFITGAVFINLVGHGTIIGFPAVLLPQLHHPDSHITITKDQESWLTSILGITVLAGNFIMPPVMGRLGRRLAHLAVTIPILLGWIVVILASGIEALIVGRILHGLSFGMILPLGSVMIGEYTSPVYRGAFIAMTALGQSSGICFVHLIGSLISWQKTSLICIFFSFTSLIMTLYSPESPSWLADKGRFDECRRNFKWLRGESENEELEELIEARLVTEKPKPSNGWNLSKVIEVLKKKEFIVPIIIMGHANIMMQFAGGTTMAAYSTTIISLIMGPNADAHFWMVALDTQRIITNSVAIYFIHKVKRRTMMFTTGGLCVGSHVAIAGYVYAKTQDMLPYDSLWIPVVLVNLQFVSVAVGMVPLPTVIAGEVFPLEYRSISGSISVVFIASFIFIVLKTFPGLISSISLHGTYLVYAGMLSYTLTVIWFLLPETRGRTLQQIEDEFKGKKTVYECHDTECKEPLRSDD